MTNPAALRLTICLFSLLLAAGARPIRAEAPPLDSPAQAIDQYLDAMLQLYKTAPAPPAEDAVLLRRLMLDLVGRPPSPWEREQFLSDKAPRRRERWVSNLLSSKEAVEHQVASFDQLLMGPGKGTLASYLRPALEENRPWNKIFRDLVLSETPESAPFLKSRIQDVDQLTNEVSVVFFGVNISCAKCHTHPFVPEWTQDRFYGMKSFFSRTFEHGDWVGERDYGKVDFKTPAGESKSAQLMFFTGKAVDEPAWKEPDDKAKKAMKAQLDKLKKEKKPAPAPSFSRRAALVSIANAPENQIYLARAVVNQTWRRFFGAGLVDPVDQMHPENPASHPDLLQWLAEDLVQHNFNLRRLTEAILNTRAYARTSRWDGPAQRPYFALFAVAQVRPLTPAQYSMTLQMGATSPLAFQDAKQDRQQIERVRAAARGMHNFFQPVSDDFQVSVTEALRLSNSEDAMKRLLKNDNGSLMRHLQTLESPEAKAKAAWLQVFGAQPDPKSLETITTFLRSSDSEETTSHMLWSLLTSSACRFNY